MSRTGRVVKGLASVGSLVGLGLGLRWVTAGSADAAVTQDLTSMASVAIGAISWVAYCWLVVAFLATALEQAPGAIGRSAAVVADWVTSQSSRALLRSALGVAAVSPLTIAAAHATPGDGGPQQSVQRAWTTVERPSAVQLGSPGRWNEMEPRSVVQLPAIADNAWRAVERPSRASVVPDQQDGAPRQPLAVPDRPTDGAPTRYTDLRSGREVRPTQPVRSPRRHVVQPGDSLWALAAAELGPGASDASVAARWPRWYAVNAAVIGPDPDLLIPGQVLRVPDRSMSSATQEK